MTPETEEMSEEERMAAEWAAAADGGDEGGAGEPQVLSQDEIDSLLGISKDSSQVSGIQFLINNSKISHERLPMLEVIFDRLVRQLTTSLRNFSSSTVDVNLYEITSVRFGDYLESIPLPALIGVFKAIEWDSYALLTVETPLTYTTLDVLLGGRQEKSTLKAEGRPFTSIERNLIRDLMRITLDEFSDAFSTVTPVQFQFDRIEVTPRFATIVRPVDAAILARVKVEINQRGGLLEFCIPYGSIEPVRDQIVQMFTGEKTGQDNIWAKHLEEEVWEADVSLNAILGETNLPLQEVLDWKVGSQLLLRTTPDSSVHLSVDHLKTLTGKMGKRDDHVAIKLEENLIRDRLLKA